MVNRDFSKMPPCVILLGIPAKAIAKKLQRADQAVIAQLHSWDVTTRLNSLNPLYLIY